MSNSEKYLITGAAGQLGQCLQLMWGGEEGGNAVPRAREALDITRKEDLEEWLPRLAPDAVINCAGYTDVARAEEERVQCWNANVAGVKNLVRICSKNDIALFHISSDFVFGQDKSRHVNLLRAIDPTKRREPTRKEQEWDVCYQEGDTIGPVGFYGQTKAMAEHVILQEAAENPDFQYYIIRTAGLFESPWRAGKNFPYQIANWLLNHKVNHVDVVSDVVTNVTYAPHLAEALRWIVENRNDITVDGVTIPIGIYHITNEGMASWHEIAQVIDRELGFSGKLRETTCLDYCRLHGRPPELSPTFTALCSSKYEETIGPVMPPWQEGVSAWTKQAVKHFRGR